MDNLEQKIEAILFWKGEPISRKKLSEILEVAEEQINQAIERIKENLNKRGVVLLEKDGRVTMGTAPAASEIIEKLQKEELNKDLSKASLETLSIVLYKNGTSRSEIDYIRGVNSSFILRALSIRGLVEKHVDPKDNRRFIYKPSFDLISFMGVKNLDELPDYQEINSSIAKSIENVSEELKNETEV